MRVAIALAVTVLGIAGAGAAEFDIGRGYSAPGQRSAPLVVYDYQPGVVVRAYWHAPWRHRHYFPSNGRPPKLGRHENLSAPRNPPRPAETFYRSWSTTSLFMVERRHARLPVPEAVPYPHSERFTAPPERAKP